MFPFYEICSQRKLPVLTHVGPSSASLSFKHTSPISVDDAALNFPNVNFILGHAGVTLHRQAARLAQYRPNIYLDLSGFQAEAMRGQFKNILKWHISRGLSRRLLFGTDWPMEPAESTTTQIPGLKLPPDVLYAMERGNAERLFPRFKA